MHTWLLWSLVA